MKLNIRGLIVAIPLGALALYLAYTYGIDTVSMIARGTTKPSVVLYVSTDAGGLKSLDSVLAVFAKDNGLRVSRERDNGDQFPQQRELWKPGLSIMVSSEAACRDISDPTASFLKTEFKVFVSRTSFLVSPSELARIEGRLRSAFGRTDRTRVRTDRLLCTPPTV